MFANSISQGDRFHGPDGQSSRKMLSIAMPGGQEAVQVSEFTARLLARTGQVPKFDVHFVRALRMPRLIFPGRCAWTRR